MVNLLLGCCMYSSCRLLCLESCCSISLMAFLYLSTLVDTTCVSLSLQYLISQREREKKKPSGICCASFCGHGIIGKENPQVFLR